MRAAIHHPNRDMPATWMSRHIGRKEAAEKTMSEVRYQSSVVRIRKNEVIARRILPYLDVYRVILKTQKGCFLEAPSYILIS